MAQKLGYFEDAGLDVSVHTPADPAAPIKLLAEDRQTWRSPMSRRSCWQRNRASTSSPSAPSSTGP